MFRDSIKSATILVVFLLGCAAVPAFGADCIVADPTGTPLNVRSAPQGSVLSVLENGVSVEVVDELSRGGKRWAKVSANGETLGWVFAAYLDCAGADDTRKSAPMHPRTAPQ